MMPRQPLVDSEPRMPRAIAAVLATAAVVTLGVVPAGAEQAPSDLVAATSAYVVDFISRFSNVVAEERYVQQSNSLPLYSGGGVARQLTQTEPVRRRLRSEFLLVRRDSRANWTAFRDVLEVDGRPVRDHDERLLALFNRPNAGPEEEGEAELISAESARYNVSGTERTINNPLLVLGFLQPVYVPRFKFTMSKAGRNAAPADSVLEFSEIARPTLMRDGSQDLAANGKLWIESATGRIIKTELVLFGTHRLTTTFRFDERLGIAVPIEMTESFLDRGNSFEGKATYGQFRQFGVTVDDGTP